MEDTGCNGGTLKAYSHSNKNFNMFRLFTLTGIIVCYITMRSRKLEL